MQLTIKERPPGDAGEWMPDWPTVAVWPDSDCPPRQEEFLRLNGREGRVTLVVRTGPTSAEVYLEPTYVPNPRVRPL